jgi:hypothetical protein
MAKLKNHVFDKQKLSRIMRLLCPEKSAHSLTEIDLEELVQEGKKLLLIDIDNTLVTWHSDRVDEKIATWIQEAKKLGLQICFISNTHRRERLLSLSKQIDVPFVRGRFKPSRQMFWRAMQRFRVSPEETIMIGDQLFTDILGANRVGIHSIWVQPLSLKEFLGTKISRAAEKFVALYIRRAILKKEKKQPGSMLRGVR